MSWVKIDDRYATHRKILRAGPTAMALDVAGMCYAAQHGTDGHIPTEALGAAAPFLTHAKAATAAARLVEVGRWTIAPDGWQIHDFLAYNPTAADRAQRQQQTVDRVRRHRQKKREGNALTRNAGNAAPGPIPAPPKAGMGPPKAPHPQPPSARPASPELPPGSSSAGQPHPPPALSSANGSVGDPPTTPLAQMVAGMPPQASAEVDAVFGADWRRKVAPKTRQNPAEFEAKRAQELARLAALIEQEPDAEGD